MQRSRVSRFARQLVIGLLLVPHAGPSVFAHGDETLQLGADRVQPGGSLEVRGDLGVGEQFEVALISQVDGSRRTIATIPAIEEGHFDTYVTVPPDLPSGGYLVEVSARDVADATSARAPIAIAGSPVEPDGERPDQAEGLPGLRASGSTGGEPAAEGVRPSRAAILAKPAEPAAAQQMASGLALVGGAIVVLASVVVGRAIVRRAHTDRS